MRLLLFVSASQCQTASQKAMDQMNAAHEASLSSQFHQKIQEMVEELDCVRTSQQDSFIHRESMHTERQWYQQLYNEEPCQSIALVAELDIYNQVILHSFAARKRNSLLSLSKIGFLCDHKAFLLLLLLFKTGYNS